MKIIQIIFTRNEGNLLRQNIEFHLKMGVDFFIITDNDSTDNTRKVMREFERRGVAKCFYSYKKTMAQKESMEYMAKIAHKFHKADWVIVSDTDEFWYTKGGLKKFLKNISSHINVLKVLRYQYFPTSKDDTPVKKIFKKMLYRENGNGIDIDTGNGNKSNDFARKKIIFKPIADHIDILFGNHTVHFRGRRVREVSANNLMVREFPFRSFSQFRNKVCRMKKILYKNSLFIKNKNYCTHWRVFVEALEQNKLKDFYYKYIFFNSRRLNEFVRAGKIVIDDTISSC
jgi:hypothetical protein